MAQIFPRSANALARVTLLGAILGPLGALGLLWLLARSPYVTGVGTPIDQPIPFSHKHHVGDDGIACEDCHTTVHPSRLAGLPPPRRGFPPGRGILGVCRDAVDRDVHELPCAGLEPERHAGAGPPERPDRAP